MKPENKIIVPRRKGEAFNAIALNAAGLRPNMWVVKDGVVGILTGCSLDGIAEVTMTKPDGTNKMMLDEHDKAVPATFSARVEDLQQATNDEIPEARRPAEEASLALGYMKGGV